MIVGFAAAPAAAADGQLTWGVHVSLAPTWFDPAEAPGIITPYMHRQLGLDQPLLTQFGVWLWGVAHFDFGTSLWTGRPVIEELVGRLPLSLELAILATIVSVLLAIPFGVLAAARRDTWIDYLIRVVSIGGLAIPSFWVGILIILLLVIYFGWGPPLEYTPPWIDPWANFQQMVWPVVTVGYRYAAVTTRMTRSTLLEVLGDDYIRTAWAKGLRERAVVVRHGTSGPPRPDSPAPRGRSPRPRTPSSAAAHSISWRSPASAAAALPQARTRIEGSALFRCA